MKHLAITLSLLLGTANVHALVVSEIMSNPTGDDSGREWIELHNDTDNEIDLTSLRVSIKGGSFVVTTPLQGGLTLPARGYAIVGSTVSGATKFLQDYPSYSGLLFRSSLSLVNTGVTSIDVQVSGTVAASVPSYTAAKEGYTLSYVGGSYVLGIPTPGADNQASDSAPGDGGETATTTNNQATIPQMSPPSPDIIIYMPSEKVAVAGAETSFDVFSTTRNGKPINDLKYAWAFGDGGQGTGSSTQYRYAFTGRYVAYVEATSAHIGGTGRMTVRVVPPDIAIVSAGTGKYGAYVDIRNPNEYDLDLSQWTLVINGAGYPFPKNTIITQGTTRFSGVAMGFASTTFSGSTTIKIMFPHLEEVTRYEHVPTQAIVAATTSHRANAASVKTVVVPKVKVLGAATTSKLQATTTVARKQSKDTRIVSWFKAVFGH